jgi:hypothetical protein
MKKLTIKEYAQKHKLSIFNVTKMVRGGDIKTQTKVEEGKEVLYILEDEAQQQEVANKIIQPSQESVEINVEAEIHILKKELKTLQQEVAHLKAHLASK